MPAKRDSLTAALLKEIRALRGVKVHETKAYFRAMRGKTTLAYINPAKQPRVDIPTEGGYAKHKVIGEGDIAAVVALIGGTDA